MAVGLPLNRHAKSGEPVLCASNNGFYANGRSCIYACLKMVKPRCAWLPSYLCESVLHPFWDAGIEVKLYRIRGDLTLDDFDWLEKVRDTDLVLEINYFGLRSAHLAEAVKGRGATFLQDCSQALFARPDPDADFTVYSPRKFVPVPDGGVLVAKAPPSEWRYDTESKYLHWALNLQAMAERARFDSGKTESKAWYGFFKEGERLMPTGETAMSNISKHILEGCIDWRHVAESRRRNFAILADLLEDVGLLHAGNETVPLGFPLAVKNRPDLLRELHALGIFAPVHWNLEGLVPERFSESHALSRMIVTIPCDQRYGVEEMRSLGRQVQIAIKRAQG